MKKKSATLFEEEAEDESGDGFIHLVDTDEMVGNEYLMGENLEDTFVEGEEDLEHWSLTTCPKCQAKFDLTTCKTSGENIICPTCHALL